MSAPQSKSAKRVIPHMQSATSAFRPPPIDQVDYPYPMNTLGFHIDIPHRPPVATPWYFGENPVEGRRELVTRADPEYFAVNNIVPWLTPKIPLVDITDPSYRFSRANWTFYV